MGRKALISSFSRAKLYRFQDDEKEWKERGTGEVKFLKHKKNGKIRLLMRRDKTLKICANHLCTSSIDRLRHSRIILTAISLLVTRDMELKPHVGSDKAFVYHVAADYADEKASSELLAIRFGSTESTTSLASSFKLSPLHLISRRCAEVQI